MNKVFSIALCMALAFVAFNTFGQKPKKPLQQAQKAPVTGSSQISVNTTQSSKPACWMITGKNGDIEYRWDTEANVIQWINEMRTQHNEIYEYTTSTAKDINACDAKNEKQNPKKCWKIVASKNGQGVEQYLWSTETVARRKVASLQNEGYQQATYFEIHVNDEDSCGKVDTQYLCWEITIGNVVTFYWGLEADVQAIVAEARLSGQSATYMKTDKSKDSCLK